MSRTAKGYRSDFDLLIIVNDKRLTDRVEYWAKADNEDPADTRQFHRTHASGGERSAGARLVILHRRREGGDRSTTSA
jgi:hypothetical protein